MPLFPNQTEDNFYFSMNDADELLSRNSAHSIKLDDKEWPSVEHYFQAMQFESTAYQEKIRTAADSEQAIKLGKTWFKKKRRDLKQVRTVLMTRALYIKCRTYPHRGHNHYGKVLMNVRDKLLSEQQEALQ